MNCPNCGKEISENQKFCANCGARSDDITNEKDKNIEKEETRTPGNQETQIIEEKIFNEKKGESLNSRSNKIIALILCLVLILLSVFGIIQHKQYLKDIEPYRTKINFYGESDVECTLSFDKTRKNAYLSMLHKDVVIQQWQIDYLNESDNIYKLKDNTDKYTFEFENAKLNVGEPLVLNFKINEVKNLKDFKQLKQNLTNIKVTRLIPSVLDENPKTRLGEKQKWLEMKEKEHK